MKNPFYWLFVFALNLKTALLTALVGSYCFALFHMRLHCFENISDNKKEKRVWYTKQCKQKIIVFKANEYNNAFKLSVNYLY